MKKKILITGGSGYIGTALTANLLKKNTIFIVDKKNIEQHYQKKVIFLKSDFSSLRTIRLIQKERIETVIHLAAYIDSLESEKKKDKYKLNNLTKSKKFFLNLKKYTQVKKFIFSSSAAVYGNAKLPTKETAKTKPINYYGITKLYFENFLKKNHDNRIKCLCLRFFNIGGTSRNILKKNSAYNALFYNIAKCIVEKKTFNVYGDRHETKDGTCYRDFIHLETLVVSINKLIPKLNRSFEIINIGNGKAFSIKDIIEIIQKKIRLPFLYYIKKNRENEISYSSSNIRLLKKKLTTRLKMR